MKSISKFIMLFAIFITGLSHAAEEEGKLRVSVTEITPGFYMLEGVGGFVGGNIGLSIGEQGVVMIDDALAPNLDLVQDAIKGITNKPIDFLLNTHIHADHIGNNAAMAKQGAWIVAHDSLRDRLLTQGKAAVKAALPVITFSESIKFHLNGNDATILHLANAHTDGDAIIHFSQINLIHAGDTLFNGSFPYIDFKRGGSLDGYIQAQKTLVSMSDQQTKIIPGHGPLASKQDLMAALAMLEDAKKLIGDLVITQHTEDQVVKINPLAKYHGQWNWSFITTEKMTRQVYQGIKQAQ
jgi:cyclase